MTLAYIDVGQEAFQFLRHVEKDHGGCMTQDRRPWRPSHDLCSQPFPIPERHIAQGRVVILDSHIGAFASGRDAVRELSALRLGP